MQVHVLQMIVSRVPVVHKQYIFNQVTFSISVSMCWKSMSCLADSLELHKAKNQGVDWVTFSSGV
jgi:hypothetical protein